MTWEPVIGLEVHAQLLTRSKMFCRCGADYAAAPPNTRVCPVCLGLPGALPVINRSAVELTIRVGLALGSRIAEFCRFDRKNYFYADLMKGYQISQYDQPLCSGGVLTFTVAGEERSVGITRVHLEEDTAKHTDRQGPDGAYSLIDVNRAGVPLIEIVSEPDIRGPDEAREFLRALRSLLRYVGASSANMEEGAFRCDANVSVRKVAEQALRTKVEIKNMNSFRSVANALQYEIERQSAVYESGQQIVQETRGWQEARGVTVGQRSKEYAHDYRYFPEPDLPPLRPESTWLDEIRSAMPELPEARRRRYVADHGLTRIDATLLASEREFADFFDQVVALGVPARTAANWMIGDLRRLMAEQSIGEAQVSAKSFAALLGMVERGDLNRAQGQQVLEELFRSGGDPGEIAEARGFSQVSDESALLGVVRDMIAANPKSVSDYRAGRRQALGFLVGQVMRATKGQANPAVVNRLLADALEHSG